MSAAGAEESRTAAIADAKRLLRLSRTAALATLGADGSPLTTWVGCASDFDGAPLFLLSTLAQHTKNLAGDARGSLLLTSPPDRGDPLNHPRLTIGGPIAPHPDPYARKRYLQRNPKAKLYAPFADFAIYRMRIEAVHFNGGFGRADRLVPADILAPSGDAAALIEAEDALLAEINASEGLAARLAGGAMRDGASGARSGSTPRGSISPPAARRRGSIIPRRRSNRRRGGGGWPTPWRRRRLKPQLADNRRLSTATRHASRSDSIARVAASATPRNARRSSAPTMRAWSARNSPAVRRERRARSS